MAFRSIYIANPARLSLWQEQLVIQQDRKITVPMEDISEVLIESQMVTVTAAALQKLTDYGVTVYFCDEKHLPAAMTLPMNRYCRQLKQLKGQIAMTQPVRKRMWQSVVVAKITNQAKCLAYLGKQGAEDLLYFASAVRSGDPDNLEATAAAKYFPALFGPGFTRGDGTPINGALNYGYAIVRGAVARNLVTHGLEPCLGIFHHNELNQFNLADDLMEPYRPLVDLFVASQSASVWEGELRPGLKQQLFHLTNYMILQGGKRYRLMTAVGRLAESFSRVIRKEEAQLELPELLPLEAYQYE